MDSWGKILETPVTYLTAAVASLSTVVKVLWDRLNQKEKLIQELTKDVKELQEKRVKDLRRIAKLDS